MTSPDKHPQAEVERVPVTQADRDAALAYWLYTHSLPATDYRAADARDKFMAGRRDHSEIVQAFARHRLASAEGREGDGTWDCRCGQKQLMGSICPSCNTERVEGAEDDDLATDIVDDVQRSLAKGLYGRTLALSAVRRHLSALRASDGAGEPVAWLYKRNDGYYSFVEKVKWGTEQLDGGTGPLSYTETPLYATPPAAQSEQTGAEPDRTVLIERVARAIHETKGTNPDCLYQHNFEGDWPEDERREYHDPFTGEPRVQLFHRAWRHSVAAAEAAISALSASPADTEDGGQ